MSGNCNCGSHPLAPLYHRPDCPAANAVQRGIAHERIEEGEVYDDWGHPPASYCQQCSATYTEDWSGTTCTRCDGDIVKAKLV
jgi:hypothetical protein